MIDFVPCNPIYTGLGDYAAARCVLGPLFGVRGLRDPQHRVNCTMRLLKLWRHRIPILGAAGWCPALSVKSSRNLFNCRPAFTAVAPASLPCGYYRVCPFCHARNFLQLWKAFRADLFPDWTNPLAAPTPEWLRDRSKLRGAYTLANSDSQWVLVSTKPLVDVADQLMVECAHECRRLLRSRRSTVVGGLNVLGLAVRRSRLYVRVRGIRLHKVVSDNKAWPPCLWDAAISLSRLCRYPRWMLHGDPELASAVLNVLYGFKTRRSYGVLRG